MALNLTLDGNEKKPGISPTHPQFPPASPHSQITMAKKMPTHRQISHHNFTVAPSHSRSLSQSSFFSFDHLLPPLCPSPLIREPPSTSSADMALQDGAFQQPLSAHPPTGSMISSHDPLSPRRGHRRSISDIPLGFASTIQPSPPWEMPSGFPVTLNKFGGHTENVDINKPIRLVKQEFGSLNAGDAPQVNEKMEPEGEAAGDDLFSTYMNLDRIGKLNSSSVEDKDNDMDSVESGTKTNVSSENEVESGINGSCNGSIHGARRSVIGGENNHKNGKRSANGDIAPTSRHSRSLSMDSFVGLVNFNDESPRLPPSPGIRSGQHSSDDLFDGAADKFRVEFGNSEFSALEMKKIMANEKLAEVALADPKRAKRILANRQSAARSKERKLRYIADLEQRVQILQAEATTLSAQLTLLQRDSAGLTGENNELRFRLQAMEQQAHLRDALHEALTTEVQRLKIAASETKKSSHQHMLKNNYQPSQYNMYDLQHLQQNQNQNQMKQELQSPPEDEASKS